jgi:hypothetical protein
MCVLWLMLRLLMLWVLRRWCAAAVPVCVWLLLRC